VDFPAAFDWLRREWNVRRLLCEGGGRLNASLLHAGLVDELHLTICPWVFGGAFAPSLADGPWSAALPDALPAELRSHRQHGDEIFTVFRLAPPPRT
jgi:riboflavin biosynthesis pyrimidine reductase